MTSVKGHTGTFVKQNGEQRTMTFVKLPDLPDQFLKSQIKGNGKERLLKDNLELVWEVKAKGFRIFNWNTVVGEVKETLLEESNFVLDKE